MNTTQTQMGDSLNIEKLGIELSQKTKWEGVTILEITREALIDANFHSEAKIIDAMVNKLNNMEIEN